MRILVVNSGSATVKFSLLELRPTGVGPSAQDVLARGVVDRLGDDASCEFVAGSGASLRERLEPPTHETAVRKILEWLGSVCGAAGAPPRALDGVAHRVVHGGSEFSGPVLLDDEVIGRIERLNHLAPLHNPAALEGVRAVRKLLGSEVPAVAVFDTAFHHALPEPAACYALPRELALKHGIRRYGFHGLAHRFSLQRYAELQGIAEQDATIVTAHLGNGCSACAIRCGVSVDTSMGLTPLEGLIMGTRSGDLDPAIVAFLARREDVSADEVEEWLNKRSGLLGISGISNDMRELVASYDNHPRARLAVDMFCYRVRKYIGSYLAALGGAQAVIFSGGIGENSALVRSLICRDMEWCGLELDAAANASTGGHDAVISASDSRIAVVVVHTDEESVIAREAGRVIADPQSRPAERA